MGRVMVHMWKSEDNFQESILSFYHMGPGGLNYDHPESAFTC